MRIRAQVESVPGSQGHAVFGINGPETFLQLPIDPKEVELLLLRISGDVVGPSDFLGTPKQPSLFVGDPSPAHSVAFLLLNQQLFSGHTEPLGAGMPIPMPSAPITIGSWELRLWRRPDLAAVVEQLKNDGGYGVTHGGLLSRKDGAAFAQEDGHTALEPLYWGLSFARGFWSGPVAICSLSAQGQISGTWWEAPKLDRWQNVHSWLPGPHVDALGPLLAAVHEKLSDPLWGRALRLAIHWYVSSNKMDGGVEGAIVLSQTALELLAWTHLVEVTDARTPSDFNKLKASDRLRELLLSLGLDVSIPSAPTLWGDRARLSKWQDVPHALSTIRNAIVHPERRGDDQDPLIVFTVWQLGQRLVELVLLRLLGYAGAYDDRVTRQREYIPAFAGCFTI